MYGELEKVATLKGHGFERGCADPTGRFVGFRIGRAITIVDAAPDAPALGARFRDATNSACLPVISPDGARVAVRDLFNQRLEVRGAETVAVTTPTTLMTWDGAPLPPRSQPPRWGYGSEFVAFDASGEFVMLGTHQPDGQACVQLYAAADLSLVDTLTDLRLYSYYATNGEAPFVPMRNWSESTFVQDPFEPGLVLGIRNAGDSCLGVFGFRVVDGRLTQVDPAAISAAAFKVDSNCLLAMRRLPKGGLLVIDRDHHLGRVAWPPTVDAKLELHRYALRHLQVDYEVQFPGFEGEELEPSEAVSVTADHLLVNVNADDYTVGMAALDPLTFKPLGLVQRPRGRLKFGELEHLGGDLFAGVGSGTTRLWRLRR